MPRDQAVMPYWVPQVLRPHTKVRGRLMAARPERDPEMGWRVPGSLPTVASIHPGSPGRHSKGSRVQAGGGGGVCRGGAGSVSWGVPGGRVTLPSEGDSIAAAIFPAASPALLLSCPSPPSLTWPHLLLQLCGHPSRSMEEPGRTIVLSCCPHSSALSGPLGGSGFQASPRWGGWPGPVLLSPTAFQVSWVVSRSFLSASTHFPVAGLLSSNSKLSLEFRLRGLLKGDLSLVLKLCPELACVLSCSQPFPGF